MVRTYNLADLLEILAEAGPDRPALVAGTERRTYAQLDERASRVGRHLAAAGVRRASTWRSSPTTGSRIEAMLGAFKIRAVPIPVNYRYVAAELRHVLADSDSVAIIGERSLLAKVAEIRGDLPLLRHLVVLEDGASDDVPGAVEYEKALAAADPSGGFPARSSDDRYIMYTGGTTGYPKGVEWRCEDIFFGALGGGNVLGAPVGSPEELAANAEQPPMAVLDCAPVMHGAGQWVAFMGLFSGAKVVLYTDRAFDADKALRLVAEERANVLMLVGDVMARPVAKALAAGGYDTSSLIAVASGGAPLTEGAKQALLEHLPNLMFLDNYGASETGACGPSVAAARHRPVRDEAGHHRPGRRPQARRARRGRQAGPQRPHPDRLLQRPGRRRRRSSPTRRHPLVDPRRLRAPGGGRDIALLGRGSLVINTGGRRCTRRGRGRAEGPPDVDDAVVVGLPDSVSGERAPRSWRPGRERRSR